MNLRYGFIFILMLLMLFSFQGVWAQSYTNSNVGKLISNTITSTMDTITVATSISIGDIEVRVDTLIHTYDSDIDMYIITPGGDTLELSTDNGSSGDNYILTVFDQEATTPITSGSAPFTGSFIPEEDISTLVGTDAIGDWILLIFDDAGGDDGTLQQWGLDFTAQAAADAGVASIDTPGTPFCSGTGLWVTIENFGTTTLTSATVNWTLNGAAQTPFAWTGSVPSGGTDGPVMIASTVFVDNDTIVAWTSMPNGVPDGNPANDTSSTVVKTGLAAGTYTIGGVTGYPSFTAAVNDLNTRGICGPVVFDVQLAASPYVEQIELGEITGTSVTNTITFNGNGSTLRWGSTDSNNRHVLRLNGADYVTFNDLTIEVDPDSTYGWGVHLINAADHNTFHNVTVKGDTVSTSTSYLGIIATGSNSSYSTGGNNANYLTIDNCTVIGSYYGIRLNGNTGGLDAVNNTIMNSTIQDFRYYAIYLDDTDGALVSGNDISRPNRSTAQSFYGTYLTGGNINCTIEKNYYHNSHGGVPGSTSLAYVIYFSSCDAPAGQENVVKNNVIYDMNTDGTVYGIYNSGSDGAYYYNNTISLDYPSTAGTTRGFYQTTTADNIDFRNNVLTVTRGGSGTKHGLYFNATASNIISDNNAIFVNPDVNFGRFGTTEYPTYADWRTANGGAYDSLSVNADPLYVDLANGDLTPSNGQVNDIGVSLAEVTEDILGNPRGTPPDPGAYEFAVTLPDVAVSQFINLPSSALPNSVVNFDIEISNVGATAVPADSVDLFLNGSLNSSYGYDALATLESDTVSASFTTSASGTDAIVAALRMVTGDGNLLNDTLEASINIDSVYAAPYFQDFEGGAVPMGWTNETGDDFDWTPDAGGTGSSGTGPAVDHTLGTSAGYYMYTEASSPNYPFKMANLTTPYFDLTGMTSPTMEFWFHMYGQTMGELHFDVWSGGSWTNDARSPLVGQYQESDTSAWLRGGIDLTSFTGGIVKVRFRGITGSSYYSDMAIDDIRLDEYSNLTPFPDEIHAGRITMPLLTKMPLTQTGIVSSVNFEGSFDNLGVANTGDINIEVVDGTTAYSNSTTGVTIPSFGSSTFSFGPWDASTAPADQYNVLMYSSNFAGINDTAIAPLELGETMGWDYGNHVYNIAYSGTLENWIGTRFTLTDPDTLTSISMIITSSTTATDSFAVDLYTAANDTPDVFISRIYRGTFGDFGTLPAYVTFQVPGGMAMSAGDFYALLYMDVPSAASYPIAADNTALGAINIPNRFIFRGGTSDWLFFENSANALFQTFVPIIHAGFQESGEIHDYAVNWVDAEACMTVGETYTVSAEIENKGNQPESSVTVEFREDGLFMNDWLVSLNPGEKDTLSFQYAPASAGMFGLNFKSFLVGDNNPGNDADTAFVRVTDNEIVFFDDFEDTTFTFANWIVVDDPTSTGTWMIFPPPYPGAFTLPPTSSGNVVSADADYFGSGTTTISTAMLPLDLSGYDSVFVDFDSDWRILDAQDTARVNVSNDGGATWTTVLEYAGVDARNMHVSLDLTAYVAGSANAVLAAESYQPGWDWWWAIDNVCVSGMGAAPPTYTQSFEGTFPPPYWSKLNPDGGTGWDTIAVGTSPIPGWVGGKITAPPGGGNAVAFCTWTTGGATANDQYMVTPQIRNVQSTDYISFWMRYWPDSYPDTLDVVISTTDPTDPANFNILVERLGFGAGSDTNWVMYSYDLANHVNPGDNIYIGFREHVTDNYNYGASFSVDLFTTNAVVDTGQFGPPPAKLLLTEIVVTPTGGEFIEIYNPGSDPVDLSNTYLTDATFPGTPPTYYYNIVTGAGYGGGSFGDFHARFPDGATIPAGVYQTIALNGDADFNGAYGVNPTYEIDQAEFASGTPDGIPDMREAVPGSIFGPDSTHNPGLTNGDEVVILYYWDGFTDLVSDVDYLLYNSGSPAPNDEATSKTGVVIDGPDPDMIATAYLADTDSALQHSAPNHGSGFSTHRIDYTEGNQTPTGGNGVTGADETSEDLDVTWTNNSTPSPGGPIVGIEDIATIPTTFAISQNYPNPFNPTTSIKYQLPQATDVTITIYNLLGQKVRTLVNDRKEPGYYEVEWNGLNDHNVQVATGLYIYRIKAADFVKSKKMLLLK